MLQSIPDQQQSLKKTHRGPGIKQWRLIVRNLPFDTKEEHVRLWVAKYGKILEVTLPKGKDKQYPESCAGFCFVQFARRTEAERAKQALNFSQFRGRKVAVDWALDKDSWVTKEQEEKSKKPPKAEVKDEPPEEEQVADSIQGMSVEVKKEEAQNSDDDFKSCSSGLEDEEEADDDDDSASQSASDEEEEDEEEEEEESDEDESEESESGDEENKLGKVEIVVKKQEESSSTNDGNMAKRHTVERKRADGDLAVAEGRVVFLRNVPFTSTDAQLRQWLDQLALGPVDLAILVRSKDTGNPTGSAFVHFRERANADAFLDKLAKDENLLFEGRRLLANRAVPREEAKNLFKREEDSSVNGKKLAKDARNLYLLRASLIRPGTDKAQGMSEEDAKQRERLGQMARAKLKNLAMFVSPTRLAIHNIPFNFTDAQLAKLCKQAAATTANNSSSSGSNASTNGTASSTAPAAEVTECRIMRNLTGQDEKGRPIFGKSKGFAFVSFRRHEQALRCLEQMNNNPDMFTKEKRPIVEFSIENLNALRLKERRLQQSRGEDNTNGIGGSSNKAKNKEQLERFKGGDDPAAVAKTKRALMAGGQKWMPKKLGKKVRLNRADVEGREGRLPNKDVSRAEKTTGGGGGQKGGGQQFDFAVLNPKLMARKKFDRGQKLQAGAKAQSEFVTRKRQSSEDSFDGGGERKKAKKGGRVGSKGKL